MYNNKRGGLGMEVQEIIDSYTNGNISASCKQIESIGMYYFFNELRIRDDKSLYIRISLTLMYYLENK